MKTIRQGADGFYDFYPRPGTRLTARELRNVANELDELNKEFERQLEHELFLQEQKRKQLELELYEL